MEFKKKILDQNSCKNTEELLGISQPPNFACDVCEYIKKEYYIHENKMDNIIRQLKDVPVQKIESRQVYQHYINQIDAILERITDARLAVEQLFESMEEYRKKCEQIRRGTIDMKKDFWDSLEQNKVLENYLSITKHIKDDLIYEFFFEEFSITSHDEDLDFFHNYLYHIKMDSYTVSFMPIISIYIALINWDTDVIRGIINFNKSKSIVI